MYTSIEEANQALHEILLDVLADQNESAVEAGWRDLVYLVAEDSTPAVRAELLRRNGF